VGCDFGFAKQGELDGADVIITAFSQLPDHLPAVTTVNSNHP